MGDDDGDVDGCRYRQRDRRQYLQDSHRLGHRHHRQHHRQYQNCQHPHHEHGHRQYRQHHLQHNITLHERQHHHHHHHHQNQQHHHYRQGRQQHHHYQQYITKINNIMIANMTIAMVTADANGIIVINSMSITKIANITTSPRSRPL